LYTPNPLRVGVALCAAHRGDADGHLMNDRERKLMAWALAFNPFDLVRSGGPSRVHAAFMAALRFGYAKLLTTEEYIRETRA
jgi:hypothetical protein